MRFIDAYLSQSWLANEKVCVFAAFGWVELGIQKAHPFAMASRELGLKIREPKPNSSCRQRNTPHVNRATRTGVPGSQGPLLGSMPVQTSLRLGRFQGPGELG